MAWSGSAVFGFAELQTLKKVHNLNADTYFVALFTNTITPDNTVTTAAATEYGNAAGVWQTSAEVATSGTYSPGGQSLATDTSVSQVSGADNEVVFASSVQPQWTGVTWNGPTTAPAGCLVYSSTVSDEGICFNSFGGVQEITAGTFTVAWSGAPVTGSIAEWIC